MTQLSPYFQRSEFACKCNCGFDTADAALITILDGVREHFGVPITINSGCRCEAYNRKNGWTENSQHVKARAADIVVKGVSPAVVADYIDSQYPDSLGLGRYTTFTHVDTRTGKARWG